MITDLNFILFGKCFYFESLKGSDMCFWCYCDAGSEEKEQRVNGNT